MLTIASSQTSLDIHCTILLLIAHSIFCILYPLIKCQCSPELLLGPYFFFLSLSIHSPLIISSSPEEFKSHPNADDEQVSFSNSTPNACWISSPEVPMGIQNSAYPPLNAPTSNLFLSQTLRIGERFQAFSHLIQRPRNQALLSLCHTTTSKWSSS